jgi:hypothetical protein
MAVAILDLCLFEHIGQPLTPHGYRGRQLGRTGPKEIGRVLVFDFTQRICNERGQQDGHVLACLGLVQLQMIVRCKACAGQRGCVTDPQITVAHRQNKRANANNLPQAEQPL